MITSIPVGLGLNDVAFNTKNNMLYVPNSIPVVVGLRMEILFTTHKMEILMM